MKRITLILMLILGAVLTFAQAPQAFKYQAVVRDNAGEIINNQTVSFRISIRAGSALGFIVYQETHSATTNDFGLANLQIGTGNEITGTFSAIDWTSGPKYLETELDPANGSSYISLGTTQLLSVPFALYAENAGSSVDDDWTEFGANLYNNNTGNVGIGTTSPAAKLEVAGRISQTGTGNSVFLGEYAGANDDLVNNYNTFIGRFSGYQNTNGNSNSFFGQGSGLSNTTGSNNSFIGFQSGHDNLIGTDNVFLGSMSGFNETGSNKLYIENSNADKDNALIYGEFDSNILAFNGNVGIGTTTPGAALDVNGHIWQTGTGESVFIGEETGLNDDLSTNRNVGLGFKALHDNTSGQKNTVTGYQAGYANLSGESNSIFGYNSGYNNTASNNSFFGAQSGLANTTGWANTFLGSNTGRFNNTGSQNTFIGYNAGYSNNDGGGNIFIGYNSGAGEKGSNKLYIENSDADSSNSLIYGDFDLDVLAINGAVGIGTTIPSTALEVSGAVSANAFFGDGSGLTGITINETWDTSGVNIYNTNTGSVGIGVTNPDSSAILEIASTNKGLLIPRIADTDLIESPVEGLLIFDSGSKYLKYYNGYRWATWRDPSAGQWQCGDTLYDERDGQEYKTTQIGNLCWMAENLNIGNMQSGLHTDNGIIEKRCYDNDIGACTVYGGLYTWNEMMEYSITPGIQGICHEGWHIPTDFEWKYLEGTVDSQYEVGDPIWDQTSYRGYDVATNLRSQTGWILINGEDLYDFNALPAGHSYHYNPPSYDDLGYDAFFWTSSESNNDDSWARRFGGSQSSRWDYDKSYSGFSVRCVKD